MSASVPSPLARALATDWRISFTVGAGDFAESAPPAGGRVGEESSSTEKYRSFCELQREVCVKPRRKHIVITHKGASIHV